MAATALKQLTLDIISDSICPFCYLGYRQITIAMEAAKKENLPLNFKLRFKPFLLDPSLPSDKPLSKRERYVSKFGASRFEKLEQQMIATGRAVGINYSYDGSVRQTTDSHRLIEKAYAVGGEAIQRPFVEAIFAGYFEHEQDIGSHDFLAECAVKAGVFDAKDAALAFLASAELKDDVKKDIMNAMRMGVEGVPFVIMNNKYAVSGAQGQDTFLEIFRKLAAGDKLAVESDEGNMC
ncbi:thioredoxin-like protein [Mycena pura]|uniref:Thioredoxin-like protein n=1 Tax=Mycena pura TaxID=153505 RepID=A0AAD6Y7Q8_9AGAR|nr:thioredoxin-like protein [Mycena pura]